MEVLCERCGSPTHPSGSCSPLREISSAMTYPGRVQLAPSGRTLFARTPPSSPLLLGLKVALVASAFGALAGAETLGGVIVALGFGLVAAVGLAIHRGDGGDSIRVVPDELQLTDRSSPAAIALRLRAADVAEVSVRSAPAGFQVLARRSDGELLQLLSGVRSRAGAEALAEEITRVLRLEPYVGARAIVVPAWSGPRGAFAVRFGRPEVTVQADDDALVVERRGKVERVESDDVIGVRVEERIAEGGRDASHVLLVELRRAEPKVVLTWPTPGPLVHIAQRLRALYRLEPRS